MNLIYMLVCFVEFYLYSQMCEFNFKNRFIIKFIFKVQCGYFINERLLHSPPNKPLEFKDH